MRLLYLYLADFLKTNLTKFGVILVKKRQKGGFLSPITSKIIITKKKQKSEEKERRRERNLEFSAYNLVTSQASSVI